MIFIHADKNLQENNYKLQSMPYYMPFMHAMKYLFELFITKEVKLSSTRSLLVKFIIVT